MTFRRSIGALTLVALFAFAGAPAHATDATKHQKIEEFFKLIRIEKTMEQITAQQVVQAKLMVKGMFPDMAVPAEDQKTVDALLDRVLAIMHESMAWPKLEPAFVDLYAATYTEEEIDGILAFYQSPTGRSMIAKQPELIAKSQAISQERLAMIQPKLKEAMSEFSAKIAAKYTGKAQ